jgi:hypothetical protein
MVVRWSRRGAPPELAPQTTAPALPTLDTGALTPQRLAHARAFLASWRQSQAIAKPEQAAHLLEDLLALARELRAEALIAAVLAMRAAADMAPNGGLAHQRLEAEIDRVLAALS